MNRALASLFFLFPSGPVFAQALHCRADFDETSHYELSAVLSERGVDGKVGFRYLSEDGIDLKSDLDPKSIVFVAGKTIKLSASNDSMAASLQADAAASSGTYSGVLHVNFNLDNLSPVDVNADCTIR